MDREPYVDEMAAAAFLAITPRYLRDLRRAGRIPAHPLGCGGKCRVWRYRLSELETSLTGIGTNSTDPTERRTSSSQ
jgi:hypothetical protein